MNLYLVRHAPVLGKAGFIYGDDAEVDWSGQEKAIAFLATSLPSPDLADWYSSGVDRARKSAEAVLQRMGAIQKETMIHEGFREQNFGSLIGMAHDQLPADVQFINGKIYAPNPPHGETIPQLVARVAKAVQTVKSVAQAKGKQSIVIFCHGGTIRAAHIAIKNLDIGDYINLDTPPLSLHQYKI